MGEEPVFAKSSEGQKRRDTAPRFGKGCLRHLDQRHGEKDQQPDKRQAHNKPPAMSVQKLP